MREQPKVGGHTWQGRRESNQLRIAIAPEAPPPAREPNTFYSALGRRGSILNGGPTMYGLGRMTRSLFYCGFTYAVAFAAAYATADLLEGLHPLLIALAADVVATLVVFGFSLAFDNSSFYDPYWSVAPVPLAIYFALQPAAADALDTGRVLLVLVLV